jgi:hypothetical protein
MPRVVPTMVVNLIDTACKDGMQNGRVTAAWAPKAPTEGPALAGILALIDALPGEFLAALSPEDYTAFIVNVAAIRNQLEMWQVGDKLLRQSPLYSVKGYSDHPVEVVRRVLKQCPDELPAVGAHELDFITDEQFRGMLLRDIGSTEEALGNNEYKAAAVLAGSVIEAVLLWALRADNPNAVRSTIEKLQKKLKNVPVDDLTDRRWGLREFLIVVREREILDDRTTKIAELAQDFRNLIHPGKEVRDKEVPSREMARLASGAISYVVKRVATWARETADRPMAD